MNMNTISAKIITDSVSPIGVRLITMECTFPRFILAQVNTHRQFSRNSASSRAIPISKRIAEVETDPYIPINFGANQPGMQAGPVVGVRQRWEAQNIWRNAAANAAQSAKRMAETGVHKEVVNRLLEPFLWHKAIISATEWENFFEQRLGDGAQPEIRDLARAMRDSIDLSIPQPVFWGDYHLPYITPEEIKEHTKYRCMAMSVARCARVSYLNHDGTYSVDKDMALFHKLKGATPPHLSPFEHIARPSETGCAGNFHMWEQFRHILEEYEAMDKCYTKGISHPVGTIDKIETNRLG